MKRFLGGLLLGVVLVVGLLGAWLYSNSRRFGSELWLFEGVPRFVEDNLPGARVLDVSISPDSRRKVNYVHDQLFDVHVSYQLGGRIKKIVLVYGKAKGTWIIPNVTDLVILDDTAEVVHPEPAPTPTSAEGFAGGLPAPPAGTPAGYLLVRPVLPADTMGVESILLLDEALSFNTAEVLLSADHVDSDRLTIDRLEGPAGTEYWIVTAELTPAGSTIWRSWTKRNVGSRIGIFLDGELLSAPVIRSPMSGTLFLEGGWSGQEAEAVMAGLRRSTAR